jgi:hypothetical protein
MSLRLYLTLRNLLYLVLVLWLVSALASCGSVHKTSHTAIVTHDSTYNFTKDVSGFSTTETIKVKTEDLTTKTETEITFDTTNPRSDYPPKESDYACIDSGGWHPTKGGFFMVDLHGNIITNRTPKSIKITKVQIGGSKDSTAINAHREVKAAENTNTHVNDTSKVVDTSKQKTGMTIWTKLTLLGVAGLGIYMLLLAWKKRKQILSTKTSNMKSLLLFVMCSVFLMSCGGAGHLPTDNVSLGQAFGHVAQSFGYWVWVILTVIGTVVTLVISLKQYGNRDIDGKAFSLRMAVCIALLLLAVLMRPCEVAANTTVEQAARGAWIGY